VWRARLWGLGAGFGGGVLSRAAYAVEAVDRGRVSGGSLTLADYVRRISCLRSISMFACIPDHNLLPVCDVCIERVYAPGDVIFAQGDRGEALCVIIDGEVSIQRDDEEINTCGPQSCVGEVAVLGATVRTASVIAITQTSCVLLEASQFRAIARANGELAMGLVGVLNERLRVATEREAALRALTNKLLADRSPS
jgi:CRP-like cAMP-binding protein